jgi:V8-like Glu-specific endopeptidase
VPARWIGPWRWAVAPVLALGLAAAPSEANTYQRPAGAKQRYVVPDALLSRAPFNAVVKLLAYDPARRGLHYDCAAALVEDPHILVTNAHCVVAGGRRLNVRALYGYARGRAAATHPARIIWVGTSRADGPGSDASMDVAVLYVRNAPPFPVRPFTIDASAPAHLPTDLEAVGPSGDVENGRVLLHDPGCHNHGEFDGAWKGIDLLYHDCNLTDGGSGSPLFYTRGGLHYLVGINRGEIAGPGHATQLNVPYSFVVTNVGVKAAKFAAAVRRLKKSIGTRQYGMLGR